MNIRDIPNEILFEKILKGLNNKSLCSINQASNFFSQITSAEVIKRKKIHQYYNDLSEHSNKLSVEEIKESVEIYNANKKSFPANAIVGAFRSKLDFDFPYWQLSEQKVAEQESYTVQL